MNKYIITVAIEVSNLEFFRLKYSWLYKELRLVVVTMGVQTVERVTADYLTDVSMPLLCLYFHNGEIILPGLLK